MNAQIRTARATGLLYLGLAITGGLGFLLIRPRLFTEGDAGATLLNLVEHASLARSGVAVELLVVVTQTLTAAWFYRLYRTADPVAAAGLALFGMVNAIVVLVSAALLATAAQLALDPVGDAETTVYVLYVVSGNLWGVGASFFGLWLIPMGRCVLRSGWMPRPLGWILIAGGIGYLVSAFTAYLFPNASALTGALAYPATVGELWMIGYLLIRGVRRHAPVESPPTTPVTAG